MCPWHVRRYRVRYPPLEHFKYTRGRGGGVRTLKGCSIEDEHDDEFEEDGLIVLVRLLAVPRFAGQEQIQ